MWQYNYSPELYHYGVMGMKWGVRRYQNKDGSLTAAGKKRQAKRDAAISRYEKTISRSQKEKDYSKKALEDIELNKKNSKYVKEKYYNDFADALADKQEYLTKNGEQLKDYEKLNKKQKKELTKDAIESYKHDLERAKNKIEVGQKAIKSVKNTPIWKTSYVESERKSNKMTAAGVLVGAALPVVGTYLITKKTGGTGFAVVGSLLYGSPFGAVAGGAAGMAIGDRLFKTRRYLD